MFAGKNPWGHVDLRGTILEVEGLKKGLYHTFGVVTRGSESLIRVSTSEAGTLALWVAKLQAAGCAPPRMLSPEARSRSPLRSADVRWVRMRCNRAACISVREDVGYLQATCGSCNITLPAIAYVYSGLDKLPWTHCFADILVLLTQLQCYPLTSTSIFELMV